MSETDKNIEGLERELKKVGNKLDELTGESESDEVKELRERVRSLEGIVEEYRVKESRAQSEFQKALADVQEVDAYLTFKKDRMWSIYEWEQDEPRYYIQKLISASDFFQQKYPFEASKIKGFSNGLRNALDRTSKEHAHYTGKKPLDYHNILAAIDGTFALVKRCTKYLLSL